MAAVTSSTSRPRRRWFQFSLRTFCIASFVLALMMALAGNSLWRLQRQRELIRAIQWRGGIVQFENHERSPYRPIETALKLPYEFVYHVEDIDLDLCLADEPEFASFPLFPRLKRLSLEEANATERNVKFLARLKHLKRLDFHNTNLNDSGLAQLRPLTTLQYLDLRNTEITDAGMETMACFPELQYLFLDDTNVTDAGLIHLRELAHLKWMVLVGTGVTESGAHELKCVLPSCRIDIFVAGQVHELN